MVKEGVYMDRISYNDIDFNKLTKLDYDSLESDIYIDKEKQKIYKIFKTEDLCELSYKLVKLDLLQRRNQKGKMIVPDTTIFDRHFCGTIEKYVPGVNLDDIFIKYRDINHIMKIFLDASEKIPESVEQVVVADLNSANIRIDENDKSHYIDTLSYRVENLDNDTVSYLLKEYLNSKNIQPKKITKEMDKITFLLMYFNLLFNKSVNEISYSEYEKKEDEIKCLKNLYDSFMLIKSRRKKIDVPYLHEVIDPLNYKKY